MAEVDRLCALQVGVAGHRPVRVLAGAREQSAHQPADLLARKQRALARVEREVGHDLVVARARGVQPARDRSGDLGQAPLDRHVDVFVVGREGEPLLGELHRDRVQAREQRIAILRGDDLALAEHLRVGARDGDVLRP